MTKTEIPSDRESKPEDSAPSLPRRDDSFEDLVVSSNRRTPLFIKGGMVMGILAGTILGMTYLLNRAYNDDEINIQAHGVIECRKVDGAYANTILTKGDPKNGRDYIKIERNTWNKSRIYIGYKGCSSVDEILLREGVLGAGISLDYRRAKDGELKSEMFANADAEMQEQCARFKPMMKIYLP